MRRYSAAFVLCLVLASSAMGEERIFPYKAYISRDDVYVRSGPGQTYYPTDKLKAGQEVEIYRHDPGGWYAIKPPEASFTWVSARFLKPGVDNLAVVTEDRVAARVGSRFSDIRDVIQVRLHKAEVVDILEMAETGSASDPVKWCKIAPPSGEFRWVFGKYVDPDYQDGIRKTPAADKGPVPGDSVVVPPPTAPIAADSPKTAAGPPQSRPPDNPMSPERTESPEDPPVAAALPAGTAVAVRSPGDRQLPPDDVDRLDLAPLVPRTLSPDEYRERIQQLDVDLSVMVAEEPTVWDFRDMRLQADELADQAQTAVERGFARVLLNKIDRFDDLKLRYDRIESVRRQAEHSRSFADLERRDRTVVRRPQPEDRFDGVGQLTRVVSEKLGAPRYALVDRDGQVRCYVSPAPGMNLRYYVGQEVGVSGTRGYMPEQRAHHVMAQHVNVLDGGRIR
ncbi:MAG: SH3 domain-containing protein [Pirellulales bacterium]|nr:SH3 domain-containing protein [Pirellulales bacterium]